MDAATVQPAGFPQERPAQRADSGLQVGSRQARNAGQAKGIGHQVKPVTTGQGIVVAEVVAAGSASAAGQGQHTGPGEIVSVNVGVQAVFSGQEGRNAGEDAGQRQALGGIDAGGAQQGQAQAGTLCQPAPDLFGIQPAAGPCRPGCGAAGLVNGLAMTVSVNADGTDIGQ